MFKKGEGGRPKGSENKTSTVLREVYAGILERNQDRIERALDQVYQRQPAKFLDFMVKLSEFILPKLRAVDTTIDVGEDSIINKISVEVVTKEKNNGSKDTSN